jgi:hypothetical protein
MIPFSFPPDLFLRLPDERRKPQGAGAGKKSIAVGFHVQSPGKELPTPGCCTGVSL